MSHMKRISAPKTWPLARKQSLFVIRPNPGRVHQLSLPLGFILKDVLGICETLREVKVLLSHRKVQVGGVIRSDYKHPVGLYDVISLSDQSYRVTLSTQTGKLSVIPVDAKEKDSLLQQITSKQLIKGGVVQIGFLGGTTIRTDSAKEYLVGDSVVLDANKKIAQHISFAKGAKVQFIGGKHIGKKGVVQSIEGQKIMVLIGETPTETLRKYALVIGEKTEVITV